MNRKTSKNKIKNNSKKKRTIKRIRREKEKEKEVEKKRGTLKNNFYHYVNNNWIASNYISKDMTYKSPFTILQKTVDNQLLKCVKNLIKTNKQCKALFVSSVNWNDALVETQTYSYIKQINEFRKDENNLYPFLKWSLYNGLAAPIDLLVLHDVKKENKYLATISENGLAFNVKDIYFKKEKEYADTREYYCKFIQQVFDLFFGKNNEYNAKSVLEVECELAKHMFSISETDSVEKTYNKMTLKKAKQTYHFDAHTFLKEFGLIGSGSKPDINLLNPEYVKNAMIMMHKEWTSVKWNSYWVFKLLMTMASFHSKLYAFVFEFFLVKIRGANPKMLKREMVATYNMSSIMNAIVSREYIKHFKNVKEIEYVTELIERIKRTFKERITKNEWLSQETKEYALIKIDKMIQAIGYREKWDPDPDCEFIEYDAFGNNQKYVNWYFDQYKAKLVKGVLSEDQKRWKNMDEMTVFTVNAYYNNTKNEIILPNAILQKPFLDITKPLSHNLAFIGFIIGHELVHAFDSQGSLYDEKGLFHYWWTKEDRSQYSLLQKDVINHYEALAKKDGHKLDGNLTLDENIADISALNIIEDTLETYLIEQNIFGEKQTAFFKDLYYNYAKQWRAIIKPKQLKQLLMTDQHSLAKYRVNCVLMRSKRFNQIFNIRKGDEMFYSINAPEIW
jgi:putative endopeptidase